MVNRTQIRPLLDPKMVYKYMYYVEGKLFMLIKISAKWIIIRFIVSCVNLH